MSSFLVYEKILFINLNHPEIPHVAPEELKVYRVDYPIPNPSNPNDLVELSDLMHSFVEWFKNSDALWSQLSCAEIIVVGLPDDPMLTVIALAVLDGFFDLDFCEIKVIAPTQTETGSIFDLSKSIPPSVIRKIGKLHSPFSTYC